MQPRGYPVNLSVDYPDRQLNRLTTFFRLFTAIPILILLGTVAGGTWEWSSESHATGAVAGVGGALFFAPLLMILFRRKYPRWWFDWNLELQRFLTRTNIYLSLMDDRYPSTDEHQSVHLDYYYPDASRDLNRWLPLVKWLAADSALHRAVLPGDRSLRRGRNSVVRDPVHRSLPARTLRLRRGRHPLADPGDRICVHAGHRCVPAISAEPVTGVATSGTGRRARDHIATAITIAPIAVTAPWMIRTGAGPKNCGRNSPNPTA